MTTLLLDRILKLKDPLGFVIIKDTILQSGYLITKEFVKGITKNEKNNVIFLCVESSPQKESNKNNRIITLYHSDIPTYPTNGTVGLLNINNTLLQQLSTTAIIIKNIEQSRKMSSSLKDERIVNIYNNIPDSGICIIEYRKKSGKIIYETNAYYVDESTGDLKIQPVNEINEESKLENTLDPTTANLLFNLSLTEEQKKEKNKVILPHVKIQGKCQFFFVCDI
ncbi:7402_t:CDS:2 [Diversispora eburnea]|uniref:Elongator complex protein 5 n=1 Tax=Diversispora eburnea TaxID=1213867 RepID=A0A9N8VK37_9GLOM|nr:7402_t:CDS:2 [Diversispora eburnea]